MPGIIDVEAQACADRVLGSGSPANVDIGAFSVMPANDGSGGTEFSGSGYARFTVTNNATNFPAASVSGGYVVKQLNVQQTLFTATGALGTLVGFGIWVSGTLRFTAEAIGPAKPVTVVAGTDLFTSASHGFTANQQVVFRNTNGALPAPLAAGTIYYVISSGLTANDFKVSLTLGGASIDVTDTGNGTNWVALSYIQSVINQNQVMVGGSSLPLQFRYANAF